MDVPGVEIDAVRREPQDQAALSAESLFVRNEIGAYERGVLTPQQRRDTYAGSGIRRSQGCDEGRRPDSPVPATGGEQQSQ
ncbi:MULTISPECIES: hypothetical protein [unclassified Streptomyces]|uniref:hypothetical protein n=1 Tax=unclassified Streptomyces TaxID=2593676 RepID=UPI002DD8DB60|nr:hypothetical protein [Streptomyces sp. NBC_01750]